MTSRRKHPTFEVMHARLAPIAAITAGILFLLGIGFFLEDRKPGAQEFYSDGLPSGLPQALAADFPLPRVAGGVERLDKYAGKVLLVNFWATWCGPCIREMPSLYKLRERFASRPFEIISVTLDDDPVDAKRELEKKFGKAPFPIFYARGAGEKAKELSRVFRVSGVPISFILDRKGQLQKQIIGERDWSGSEAVELIEKWL